MFDQQMVLRTLSLTDRQEDIILLAQAFLIQAAKVRGQKASLTRAALLWVQQADWPGQVRALKAVMTAAAALMDLCQMVRLILVVHGRKVRH